MVLHIFCCVLPLPAATTKVSEANLWRQKRPVSQKSNAYVILSLELYLQTRDKNMVPVERGIRSIANPRGKDRPAPERKEQYFHVPGSLAALNL